MVRIQMLPFVDPTKFPSPAIFFPNLDFVVLNMVGMPIGLYDLNFDWLNLNTIGFQANLYKYCYLYSLLQKCGRFKKCYKNTILRHLRWRNCFSPSQMAKKVIFLFSFSLQLCFAIGDGEKHFISPFQMTKSCWASFSSNWSWFQQQMILSTNPILRPIIGYDIRVNGPDLIIIFRYDNFANYNSEIKCYVCDDYWSKYQVSKKYQVFYVSKFLFFLLIYIIVLCFKNWLIFFMLFYVDWFCNISRGGWWMNSIWTPSEDDFVDTPPLPPRGRVRRGQRVIYVADSVNPPPIDVSDGSARRAQRN